MQIKASYHLEFLYESLSSQFNLSTKRNHIIYTYKKTIFTEEKLLSFVYAVECGLLVVAFAMK